MSYSRAAFSPRILRLTSVVTSLYSPSMSSGISKSANCSSSHFGCQIA
jgi:hypothetical protein